MEPTIILLVSGLFVAAAYSDVRSRRIPNLLVLAIALLGFLRIIFVGAVGDAFGCVAAAAGIFLVGFLLFWCNMLGGGDVKLFAVTVLVIGSHAVASFLFLTGVFGIAVTLMTLGSAWLKPRVAAEPCVYREVAQVSVPYGVAISAAALFTLFPHIPRLV